MSRTINTRAATAPISGDQTTSSVPKSQNKGRKSAGKAPVESNQQIAGGSQFAEPGGNALNQNDSFHGRVDAGGEQTIASQRDEMSPLSSIENEGTPAGYAEALNLNPQQGVIIECERNGDMPPTFDQAMRALDGFLQLASDAWNDRAPGRPEDHNHGVNLYSHQARRIAELRRHIFDTLGAEESDSDNTNCPKREEAPTNEEGMEDLYGPVYAYPELHNARFRRRGGPTRSSKSGEPRSSARDTPPHMGRCEDDGNGFFRQGGRAARYASQRSDRWEPPNERDEYHPNRAPPMPPPPGDDSGDPGDNDDEGRDDYPDDQRDDPGRDHDQRPGRRDGQGRDDHNEEHNPPRRVMISCRGGGAIGNPIEEEVTSPSAVTNIKKENSTDIEFSPVNGSQTEDDIERWDAWLTAHLRWLRVNRVTGHQLDGVHIDYLGVNLSGVAQDWFSQEVEPPTRERRQWRYEELVCALYRRFITVATAQKAVDHFMAAKPPA
ncbi:hypothetical protein BJ138DRAFT_1119847 [Hygrophoropsis aurantiaca]|uniref:Uncharacterized protein n=1 Tax=Hygrophoropsis aurantiaca TaxID=72124 RepID=A0ACB7ZSU0_9AGAM|nr:hypothetical protein BJ138DRAFT_1119847 [Hygrophoropsis aurantiaca]